MASVAAAPVPNLRDVGGHETAGGRRVRRGLVYRSTDLARVDGEGLAGLARLGIRTVFDLRTPAEVADAPDRLPDGASQVVIDVFAGSGRASPAEFGPILRDPARATEMLGNGAAERFFPETYRELVRLPGARAGFGRLFHALAEAGTTPALVHCTTGKDRTGWATAALLTFLGVPREAVLADYLASGPALEPLFRPALDAFAELGGDPGLLRPLVTVDERYLEAAFDEVRREYGSIDGYVERGLGLDALARRRLREALLE